MICANKNICSDKKLFVAIKKMIWKMEKIKKFVAIRICNKWQKR